MKKAIIFDLDGTIADTTPLTVITFKETIRELTGKETKEYEIINKFGPPDLKLIEDFIDGDKKIISRQVYIKQFKRNVKKFLKPINGIFELLEYIKNNETKLGLFTGRSFETAKIVLDRLEISDKFDGILSGENIIPKPDPTGIFKILSIIGANSLESFYVGDLDSDIEASKKAGIKSILALWSSTANKKFIKKSPYKYFISPYQFISWLEMNNYS